MLIIHERNRVINIYYNQRNTTHEVAKIEKYQSRYICYHKEERESKQQKYKYQELSFKDYKLLSKEKSSVELVDILYQYYCFILTLIIPLFLYLQFKKDVLPLLNLYQLFNNST